MNLEEEFAESLKTCRRSVEYVSEELFLDVTDQIVNGMKKAGVSRSGLAKRMGTQPSRITALLSGRENLTLKTLVKMCLSLDLKASIELFPFGAERARGMGFETRETTCVGLKDRQRSASHGDSSESTRRKYAPIATNTKVESGAARGEGHPDASFGVAA